MLFFFAFLFFTFFRLELLAPFDRIGNFLCRAVNEAQFRRRASAVPNLIQLGSTVVRQKYDCDSDVPESYQIQDLLY